MRPIVEPVIWTSIVVSADIDTVVGETEAAPELDGLASMASEKSPVTALPLTVTV